MIKTLLILFTIVLSGCIGIDFEDDPIVGERIEVTLSQVALQIDQTFQAEAVFYDQYGLTKDVAFNWVSSAPAIASVNGEGLITAHAGGLASITVSFSSTQNEISVNVVLDENQVASVVLSSPANQTSLMPGEMISLNAMVKNINGLALQGRQIAWFSENASIASVNAQGVVTGIGLGMVDIYAMVEGLKSNTLTFTVGTGRAGVFIGTGGYKAIGTASLSVIDNKLILELSSNFETSFALGTFIYLANSTSGAQVRASGLEIALITTNGGKTFDVSAINPSAGLLDYKYVIILCKPASLTFGFAELK